MKHYINKDALLAEIERRRRDWRYGSSIEAKFKREECDDILSFLDTLQAKEVDLGESARHYLLQKIREEVARIQLYSQSEVLKQILDFIDSLQEEPVSEEFEEALAREWQGYNDRGAATVDALEDNTQELTFAKGFYRGAKWQKEQMMKETVAEQECKCMQIMHRIIGGSWNLTCPTDKMGLKDGDKVKIKIIKED